MGEGDENTNNDPIQHPKPQQQQERSSQENNSTLASASESESSSLLSSSMMTSTTTTTNPCNRRGNTTTNIIQRDTFVASLSSSSLAIFLSRALLPSIARAASGAAVVVTEEEARKEHPMPLQQPRRRNLAVLSIPLTALPNSGCFGMPVTISHALDDEEEETTTTTTTATKKYVSYLAIVDTGSPFLTASPQIAAALTVPLNKDTNKNRTTRLKEEGFDFSYEQYGTTVGRIDWKRAPWVTVIGNGATARSSAATTTVEDEIEIEAIHIQDAPNIVVGLPSERVQETTGGIFVGLMKEDQGRPTFLQQFGYEAFAIRFKSSVINSSKSSSKASLMLWKTNDETVGSNTPRRSLIISPTDPTAMALVDLTPYGPNLHHYGVVCQDLECTFTAPSGPKTVTLHIPAASLSRPVVAILDTGLSGCICSDTLWDELQPRLRTHTITTTIATNQPPEQQLEDPPPPIGCTVWLPTIASSSSSSSSSKPKQNCVELSSDAKYWRFQSFCLPWWYEDTAAATPAAAAPVRSETDTSSTTPLQRLTTTMTPTRKVKTPVPAPTTNSTTPPVYPHVIVLGSTFWRHPSVQELAIDTISHRATITRTQG